MSFFYFNAVKGDMPIHLLEKVVRQRLDYLKNLSRETSVYNEYVIEGSLYDNVGHFMLCVVVILGKNSGFTQFFLKAEVDLFLIRLNTLSPYDIRCFAKKLLRCIKKCESLPNLLEPLTILCEYLLLKHIAQHICESTHSISCSTHVLKVNFKQCLYFIAKRLVVLKNGTAYVPCGRWKQYFVNLFSLHLRNRIFNTDLAALKCDPRVKELLLKLENEINCFPSHVNNEAGIILTKNVDSMTRLFPPCMLNLHQILRHKHRLTHSQRFFYSLYLKDIGMPVEEAVEFWRAEYRQSPNGQHTCCHNWEKDEKKYLYGIRHMYGLEGARKNYSSVSCQRIQNDITCAGGCPFKNFDEPNMTKLLMHSNDTNIERINEYRRNKQYTLACVNYLQSWTNNKTNCNNVSFNFTPVKYFVIASKLNTV